jgi:hypothetical protein
LAGRIWAAIASSSGELKNQMGKDSSFIAKEFRCWGVASHSVQATVLHGSRLHDVGDEILGFGDFDTERREHQPQYLNIYIEDSCVSNVVPTISTVLTVHIVKVRRCQFTGHGMTSVLASKCHDLMTLST